MVSQQGICFLRRKSLLTAQFYKQYFHHKTSRAAGCSPEKTACLWMCYLSAPAFLVTPAGVRTSSWRFFIFQRDGPYRKERTPCRNSPATAWETANTQPGNNSDCPGSAVFVGGIHPVEPSPADGNGAPFLLLQLVQRILDETSDVQEPFCAADQRARVDKLS